MKLTSSSDKALTTISALVYGDSGIGKTTSLKTLPVDRTLIGCSERSLLALREKDYKVVHLREWGDLRELLVACREPDSIKDDALKAVVKRSTVLVIDSLSEVSDLCMRHIVQVDRKQLIRDRTKDKTDKPKDIYEEQLAIEDWQLYRMRMLSLISAFAHLSINVIFTCLAAWTKDKTGGERHRTPNLSGKAARECAAYFDLVLHMESRTNDDGQECRMWRTYNDGETIAKDSSGVLDPFEPSDWTKLFTKILSTNTKGKTK